MSVLIYKIILKYKRKMFYNCDYDYKMSPQEQERFNPFSVDVSLWYCNFYGSSDMATEIRDVFHGIC